MNIIEIRALSNGAHRNQNGEFSAVPDGWAVIPETITVPETFPFVSVQTEEIAGTPTVTALVPAEVPAPAPLPA